MSGKIEYKQQGFTIVELLIVIVVIAILAAISIVAYNGIQERANDAAVRSDANTIAKKLEIFKLETGSYPVLQADFPADLHVTKGSYSTSYNNVLYCLNKNTDQYGLGLISKSGKAWVVSSGAVQDASPVNVHVTACNSVGATWANDANNAVVHGFYISNGLWNATWSLTN